MMHRWVHHADAPDYILLGWLPLPTLHDTHHGAWSCHMVWLCACEPIEPKYLTAA